MSKTHIGIVVSTKMHNTVVVEVTNRKPHPLYKKLLKKSKRFKADSSKQNAVLGDTVEIVETRPFAKDKHFSVAKIITTSSKRKEQAL